MDRYEYTVIPAPGRSDKVKGARSHADRFAATLTQALNDMAARGWDYVRSDTLPSEERSGLTGRSTVWHNVLVFRRVLPARAEPETTTPLPALPPTPPAPPAQEPASSQVPDLTPAPEQAPETRPASAR